jgi:hypothetical protein
MLRNLRKKRCSIKTEQINTVFQIGWVKTVKDSTNHMFHYTIRKPGFIVLSSLLSDLVTELAGLYGGITDTTTMMLLGIPAHIAIASSDFAMAHTNGTGTYKRKRSCNAWPFKQSFH